MNEKFALAELGQFTGTEQWFRHQLMRQVLYTEGVQYVAEKAGAYWLIDEIAFAQAIGHIEKEEFQVWKLAVTSNHGVLYCEDGNGKQVISKFIDYTDFPLPEITFYVRDNVIMLPTEY